MSRLNRLHLMASTVLLMADTGTNATSGANTQPKPFTLDDIENKFFAPEQMADEGLAYLTKVQAVAGTKLSSNFDNKTTIPAGYGLLVAPISERAKNGTGNKTVAAIACVVPTMDAIAALGEPGLNFIRGAILKDIRTKIANAVRPDKDGSPSGTIPFSIEEFIENRREGGVMKAFNEIAPDAVNSLKKHGNTFMTPALLRQICISKAFAESQFPKVPQVQWVKVLDLIIGKATAAGHDVSVLENWKATRDNAAASEMGEFDLDKLDELMNAPVEVVASAQPAVDAAAQTAQPEGTAGTVTS